MKDIGIITIHKIDNYGSVFQAYALQKVCEDLGYKTEIIDYTFPNEYHRDKQYVAVIDSQPNEPRWIKLLYARELIRQHKGIEAFVRKYQHLSHQIFSSPQDLHQNPPHYDIYITGSDQLWSPRHCKGDPAFMLQFAPDNALKISYAAFFVLSSDYEGIPNALLEAMSIGVPCISTDCSPGGAAMLIQNKKNGLLVSRNNANALADAMEYIICHPVEAELMGKNGMYVCDAFSEKTISEKWLSFIEKMS